MSQGGDEPVHLRCIFNLFIKLNKFILTKYKQKKKKKMNNYQSGAVRARGIAFSTCVLRTQLSACRSGDADARRGSRSPDRARSARLTFRRSPEHRQPKLVSWSPATDAPLCSYVACSHDSAPCTAPLQASFDCLHDLHVLGFRGRASCPRCPTARASQLGCCRSPAACCWVPTKRSPTSSGTAAARIAAGA